MLPFPGGESREEFVSRCCKALKQLVQSNVFETAAVVAHGGTFMAVLSEMEESHTSYFDWKIPHCMPIVCQVVCRSPLQLKYEKQGSDSMQLIMAGLNYRTAPIALREKFSFSERKARSFMLDVYKIHGVNGCVLISTCNRTELYLSVDPGCTVMPHQLLIQAAKADERQMSGRFFKREMMKPPCT